MGQIKMKTESDKNDEQKKDTKDSMISYSFSFPFNYWKHCKYSTMENVLGKISDWYISPKYSSLKDELLNNSIATFGLQYVNYKINQSNIHKQTFPSHITKAKVQKYVTNLKHYDNHPSKLGYYEDEEISINHLMVIIIYCGTDVKLFKYIIHSQYNKLIN